MSQYVTYIISQGDTLETISLSRLGSDQTDTIIQLNKLRYPYISDEPVYQYAMLKGSLQISSTINAGDTTTVFGNKNSVIINPLDTLFFQDFTTGNYESVVVQSSTSNSNGTISVNFQSSIQKQYTSSTNVNLYDNQQNVGTKVLKTGDTLYLPVTAPNAYSITKNTSDIYGTDISIDNSGFIQRVANGWATISGIDNLGQAVRMKWTTPLGGLPGEGNEDYGNEMFDLLGETNTEYYWQLSKTYAEQAARQDPRVNDVTDINLIAQQDSQQITAGIQPYNEPTSFIVSATLPIGSGS